MSRQVPDPVALVGQYSVVGGGGRGEWQKTGCGVCFIFSLLYAGHWVRVFNHSLGVLRKGQQQTIARYLPPRPSLPHPLNYYPLYRIYGAVGSCHNILGVPLPGTTAVWAEVSPLISLVAASAICWGLTGSPYPRVT